MEIVSLPDQEANGGLPRHHNSNGNLPRRSTAAARCDEDDSDEETCGAEETRTERKKMSRLSRLFVSAALFHACAVIAFQSAILGLGNFSATCQGGLGFDRKIYAILFISAMIYVILLVTWALYSENILEIYAFCFIQLLSIGYGCTQVYQFLQSRSEYSKVAPDMLTDFKSPVILALSNVILSVVMMGFYFYCTYHLYIEFGWKIYTTVPFKAEAKLRGVFRTYQIFTCFLKLELFFTEMFLLSHVTLLLKDDIEDPEFIVSVIAMVLAIIFTVGVYMAVRRENRWIMFFFLLIVLATLGYYSFKIFRFTTKSCRLCKRMKAETCTTSVVSPSAPSMDNLTFEHLSLFAIIVAINTTLLFLVSLNYMSKFGSGLEKIFRKMGKNRLRYARETIRGFSSRRSNKSVAQNSVTLTQFTRTLSDTAEVVPSNNDSGPFTPNGAPQPASMSNGSGNGMHLEQFLAMSSPHSLNAVAEVDTESNSLQSQNSMSIGRCSSGGSSDRAAF